MAQELSCETSLFMRSLTPNKSFGEISKIRHRSVMRVEATAFVPFSYFRILDVVGVDLVERAVAPTLVVAAGHQPVFRFRIRKTRIGHEPCIKPAFFDGKVHNCRAPPSFPENAERCHLFGRRIAANRRVGPEPVIRR
jgi:hypothetical protein